jgi:hypothetical protein
MTLARRPDELPIPGLHELSLFCGAVGREMQRE